MRPRLLRLREEPRRLDHQIDLEVAPRQVRRVALGQHLELVLASHPDLPVHRLGATFEAPVVRVVREQVRHRPRVTEVVDRHHLEVAAAFQVRAVEVPTDPPEPVDSHSNSHKPPSRFPRAILTRAPATPTALGSGPPHFGRGPPLYKLFILTTRRVCARPAVDPDPVRRRGTEHGANGGMRSSELPLRPAFTRGGNAGFPRAPRAAHARPAVCSAGRSPAPAVERRVLQLFGQRADAVLRLRPSSHSRWGDRGEVVWSSEARLGVLTSPGRCSLVSPSRRRCRLRQARRQPAHAHAAPADPFPARQCASHPSTFSQTPRVRDRQHPRGQHVRRQRPHAATSTRRPTEPHGLFHQDTRFLSRWS